MPTGEIGGYVAPVATLLSLNKMYFLASSPRSRNFLAVRPEPGVGPVRSGHEPESAYRTGR